MAQVNYVNSSNLQKFAELLATKIATELAGKVDVVSGKGLSQEDFTTALKDKLTSIVVSNITDAYAAMHTHSNGALLDTIVSDNVHTHANKTIIDAITQAAVDAWTAAQANVIETVKVNSTALTPDANKSVNITVPTAVSDLTNDSQFQTQAQVTAAIASAIATAVAGITQFDYSVVAELPASGEKGVVYLIAATGSDDPDIYDEYIWMDGENDNPGRFEKIGTSAVALSQYWSKTEVESFTALTDAQVTAAFNAAFNPSQQGA